MEVYAADAHSLVWFIAEDDQLSEPAQRILDQAEEAQVQVLVPTIVLAEITHIAQKKKVRVRIAEVLRRIEQGDGFSLVPFDFAVFRVMLHLPPEWEIHDRIMAATALYYGAGLITKDQTLRDSTEIQTVW